MKISILICALVAQVMLANATPYNPASNSGEGNPSGFRRFFQMLGLGAGKNEGRELPHRPQHQFVSPCGFIYTTTTPAPYPGPLCPVGQYGPSPGGAYYPPEQLVGGPILPQQTGGINTGIPPNVGPAGGSGVIQRPGGGYWMGPEGTGQGMGYPVPSGYQGFVPPGGFGPQIGPSELPVSERPGLGGNVIQQQPGIIIGPTAGYPFGGASGSNVQQFQPGAGGPEHGGPAQSRPFVVQPRPIPGGDHGIIVGPGPQHFVPNIERPNLTGPNVGPGGITGGGPRPLPGGEGGDIGGIGKPGRPGGIGPLPAHPVEVGPVVGQPNIFPGGPIITGEPGQPHRPPGGILVGPQPVDVGPGGGPGSTASATANANANPGPGNLGPRPGASFPGETGGPDGPFSSNTRPSIGPATVGIGGSEGPLPGNVRPNIGIGPVDNLLPPHRPSVLIGPGSEDISNNITPGIGLGGSGLPSSPVGTLVVPGGSGFNQGFPSGPDNFGIPRPPGILIGPQPGNIVPPVQPVGPPHVRPQVLFPGGSSNVGPQVFPGGSPNIGPQVFPGGSPNIGPQVFPGGSPNIGPQVPAGGSPIIGPHIFPGGSPNIGPQVLPGGSPNIGPQVLPGRPQVGPEPIPAGQLNVGPQVIPGGPQYPILSPYNQEAGCRSCHSIFPYVPPGFTMVNPFSAPPSPQCPLTSGRFRRSSEQLCSTGELFGNLQLRIISELIQQAGLLPLFQQTNNYTFFAPVDQAFLKVPLWFMTMLQSDMKLSRAFILQHFIKIDLPLETVGNDFLILNARPGGNRLRFNVYHPENEYRTFTVDGSRVLLGNIPTLQGRINIMNRVLIPNPPRNGGQYLQEVPEFRHFLKAIIAADLLPLLQGSDPITLFVPSYKAFNGFDLEPLLANATALRNFVHYHIVPGTYYSEGLIDGQYLTTLYEKEIKLSVSSDGFTKTLTFVNGDIRVLKANIPILNGVVHIVGDVLSTREFFFFEHLSEFSYMEFGAMKRNLVVDDHNHE